MYRCGSTSIPSNSLLPSVINLRAPIRRKAHIRAFEQRGEETSVSVAGFGCARRVGASRLPGCRGILRHFFAVFFRLLCVEFRGILIPIYGSLRHKLPGNNDHSSLRDSWTRSRGAAQQDAVHAGVKLNR